MGDHHSWPGRRVLLLQVFIHLYWVGGSTTGALLGSGLPNQIDGLDFAVTALFTVLALDAARAHRGLSTFPLAVGCALAARFVVPDQMLLAALGAFTAAMLARYAWLRRERSHA